MDALRIDRVELGTAGNPMDDAALQAKFRGLVEPQLGAERTQELIREVRRLPELASLERLLILGQLP